MVFKIILKVKQKKLFDFVESPEASHIQIFLFFYSGG